MEEAISLLQLQQRVKTLLASPQLREVWIKAELSDVRVSGGHCYMELLDKDSEGRMLAKCRAAIWANVYRSIACNFKKVTGNDFATGLKVMMKVSVSYHEVYGMTLIVTDINPEFTMGDLLRRRRESLLRLQSEGILDANRSLHISEVPLRVAVVSAVGAAGFGDFINQLASNPSKLAFKVALFPARLQGEGTPVSIIGALERICDEIDMWDCVVIIRGGGASSDLLAFEDYDLAAAVAQFPLPVIIGIGHERDITLLDYVAYRRVKTPTAAAAWLIGEGENALEHLRTVASGLSLCVAERVGDAEKRLSAVESHLIHLPQRCLDRSRSRVSQAAFTLGNIAARCVSPMHVHLTSLQERMITLVKNRVLRSDERIASLGRLIQAYSPEATLQRGFTMVMADGKILRSVTELTSGHRFRVLFSDGEVLSECLSSGEKND